MPEQSNDSIVSVRARLRALFDAADGEARRDVIVLAIDGIPFGFAATCWQRAELQKLRSVFPTTSSTAWLSSLTGEEVSEHGIPGVAFALSSGELINVYDYREELGPRPRSNIFTDAADAGYAPIAVLGDLAPLDCTWRELLLQGAERTGGTAFFGKPEHSPEEIPDLVRQEIESARERGSRQPKFIWCFIDADLHIHRHGYDLALEQCLKGLEVLAIELAEGGAIVASHSDHGLIKTKPDPALQELLLEAERHCDRPMGGAGRTRWLYPSEGRKDSLLAMLRKRVPAGIRVEESGFFFPAGSKPEVRAGSIFIIAEGDHFLMPEGHQYEHGSLTNEELFVPFALWRQ